MRGLTGARRGVAYVASGTVIAQVVTVGTLPFLSRIYTPEEFGYFSLVFALAAFIAPAAGLRFETAAMLPDRIEEVRALAWNAMYASVLVSFLTAAAVMVVGSFRTGFRQADAALPLWVGSAVLLSAVFALLSQLALRKQEYGLVAKRSFARAVATAAAQLGLGVAGRTGNGLIIGALFGSFVGVLAMSRRVREFVAPPSWHEMRSVCRKYWRFPALFAPSALLNSAGLQAPVIFFALYSGIAVGGQLGMAERIVGLPLIFLGLAVSQVVDADISKRLRDGTGGLRRIYLRLSAGLLGLGCVASLLLGLFGGVVIPWVLGEEWRQAGTMVQILALTAGFRLVASPLSRFLVLLQRGLANTLLDLLRVVLVGGAMVMVVALRLDVIAALWVVYLGLAVTYVATWLCGLACVSSFEIRS